MVQATSNSNFDADRLADAIEEGEVEEKVVSRGNFDADYELAQELSTPESNVSGTGSNQSPDASSDSRFDGDANKPGNPEAFRQMAHDVHPDDEAGQ
ncbi:MAG TPA: hypothetical protein V6D29_10385 [Leptolyngbyaceae cyanobacterium]